MTRLLRTRRRRVALPLLLALAVVSSRASARDVYKNFLDPAIPHHRAILDTLEKLKEEPKDAGLHNDLACLIARDGFWRDALREFGEAADLAPKDSRPLFNAGLVHTWKGEWSAARGDFRKAVGRDPGNWSAWWMLGFAEEQLGNVSSAIDAYKTSLRVDTSLFDVTQNPYAASTKLKARVLLETYEKRRARAAQPLREQLEDADRIAGFFQKKRPEPAVAEGPPAPDEEPPTSDSGPVVPDRADRGVRGARRRDAYGGRGAAFRPQRQNEDGPSAWHELHRCLGRRGAAEAAGGPRSF